MGIEFAYRNLSSIEMFNKVGLTDISYMGLTSPYERVEMDSSGYHIERISSRSWAL